MTWSDATDGTTNCADRTTTLLSDPQSWLLVDSTANTIKVESTMITDIGVHEVVLLHCLVDYPNICSDKLVFTVTITNACTSVTSITVDPSITDMSIQTYAVSTDF